MRTIEVVDMITQYLIIFWLFIGGKKRNFIILRIVRLVIIEVLFLVEMFSKINKNRLPNFEKERI